MDESEDQQNTVAVVEDENASQPAASAVEDENASQPAASAVEDEDASQPAAAAIEDDNASQPVAAVIEDNNASQPASVTGPAKKVGQATRSYMYLDSVDASVLYEKDGDWVLESAPDGAKESVNKSDKISSEPLDEEGANLPLHIVAIDALSTNDTIPCNLCDKGKRLDSQDDIAPLWQWMYGMVTQMITLANDYKRSLLQSDISCGNETNGTDPSASVDERLVSSKGTQHSFSN